MADIKYLLEAFLRNAYAPEHAIAADNYARTANIYFFETTAPTEPTYWTDWGGGYEDLPGTSAIQVVMQEFLQLVTTQAELISTPQSFLHRRNKSIYESQP